MSRPGASEVSIRSATCGRALIAEADFCLGAAMHRFLQRAPHSLIAALLRTATLPARSCDWLRTGPPQNMYSDTYRRRVTWLIAALIAALAVLPKISMAAENPKTTTTQRAGITQASFGALPDGPPISTVLKPGKTYHSHI